MAQEIKQGNIFGRIGSGIGQGLAEQLPKEIERNRLASGLEALEKESGNLSPLENLTRLAAIPGALERPQLIQSFSELARHQGKANSIKDYAQQQKKETQDIYKDFFPKNQNEPVVQNGASPSLTTPELFEKVKAGFNPRTQQEIQADAAKNYPSLFQANPLDAIKLEEDAESRNEKIFLEDEKRLNRLQRIEDSTKDRLRKHSAELSGAQSIPENIYSKIEDKAIQALKPKREGGEGLTESQAVKKYGEELDNVAREYSSANSLGDLSVVGRSAKETLNTAKSIQKQFKKRGDTRNLADTLINNSKVSPMFAYSIAEPVSDQPNLNREIKDLKHINATEKKGILPSRNKNTEVRNIESETLNATKKLIPHFTKETSPLAVAYELNKKGYDPRVFLDYLVNHQNDPELNLTGLQIEQLGKPQSYTGTINDWWLSEWSGIE